ncbi:FtsX-like permease family protein [Streptomyces sp. SID8361]|uniref:ABC transporter permease n=1 Tax=Streptomyces sp. MnatMP-M27 TaxID=1839768 RepID=UPI00081F0A70|nr:ABC transporter permease [Streptomyces sp. MnatMP-M27]MYU17825.1 FtsX-like permease family protein [Streptomyces sp. SID8361]SCG12370.1 putative ABC transport system permease protein [Streptomyces sp. MnatMP-M27]
MLRTALRNVLAHKARLLMTVLAVMLGVAFVAGTLVFTNTISDAYQKSSQKGYEGVDVAIAPDKKDDDAANPGDAPRLSQQLLDQAGKAAGAASAYGVVDGYSAVADKKGDLIGGGFSNRGGNYYPGPDGKDSRYTMTEGRAPKAIGEVALDSRTAERGHYKAGDSVRVSVDGPVRTEKVVGVFTTDDGNVAAGGTLALYDTATAQKLFGKPGQFDEIDVKAAAGTSQTTLKSEIDKILPEQAKATTGKKLAKDQAEAIEQGMSSMQTMMLVFAGIALFVGIFIIVNTFSMLVAQRTRELALMRAVGATRRQVTRSVLIEATIVGAIAAVVGLVAGIGIGAALRSVLNSTGANVPDGPLVVAPTTVLVSVLVGVVVTVLSAWLPGRRAAKIPPVAAMNSVHAAPTTRGLVVRNTIGTILAAGGIALVVAGAGMGGDGQGPMAFGAAVLVIGVFVLTPLLSRPLIAAASPVLRIFGMPGKLARQNAVRNPRRTAATASALMVGLTLITGMTVIAGSIQQGINKMAADGLRSDFVVSMGGGSARPLSPEVSKTLAKLPEVTSISPLRASPARIAGDSDSLTGVDPKAIRNLVNVDFTEGSFTALGGTKALIDDKIADDHGWKVGSTIPVTYEDGRKGRLTVGGVYEGNQMIRGVMVDSATVSPHMATVADFQVMLKAKGGATEANKDLLKKTLGENPAIKIQTKQDISDEIAMIFTLMLNMLYGLLAMAVIVAVLGVINTLAMSVFERSKEIGMLRAIGLDRRGIKRMVRLESLVISLFGGVLGLGLGLFFGWAAGELVATELPTYELVLPWGRMGLFLLMAALVGVIAALWPARRASKLNMLMAIKGE